MLKNFWQNNKTNIIHMLGFWLTLAGGFMATDGADILMALYRGDFSDTVIMDFKRLILTTLVKVLLILLFPALFPLYRKDEGILPSKEVKENPKTSEN